MRKGYSFKHLLLVVLACSIGFSAYSQQTNFNDSWGKAGFTVQQTDASHLKINYSIVEFTFSEQEIKNEVLQNISLPGYFLPNDEGAPDLPGGSRYIAVPQGATAVLNIISYRTETYTDIDMAPAPRIPLDTENGSLFYKKNDKIYSKNAFFPEKPFSLSQPTQIRGVDVVMLGITPFQYNPVTKELVVYRDVEVDITFEGGNGYFGDDNYRSRWWDPILNDILLNAGMLPDIDYNQRNLNTRDDEGYEYLIVSPDGEEFQRWADSIKVFRTMQGILTGVVTLSEIGGNTASVLEDYFDNAYNNWSIKPVAVLLLGDDGDNMETNIKAPIWQSQCASDNIYADVNDDDMPDMIFARITANNEAQVETMVTKFLNYERNPPINPDFYNHPITALGWQADRWFQICAESIGGFFKNVYGKDPVRINVIYTGNPNVDPWSTATNTDVVVDYFGPDGLGYIPASPSELGGWTGGNASMINNAINSGAFLLQHRDHGGETGWSHPHYQNSDINNLVNTDLSFIFSINCLTGKYNNGSGECFTEKFHRHTKNDLNAGALGVIAASEVSYSFVNDTYVWGMYDNMWPEFMPDYGSTPEPRGQLPAFGNAAGKYFLQQSGWPYNTSSKEVTYNLFHHHGGAFLTLYSEVPQDLTVMHNPILYSETPTFTVTADEGSFIALTVNGEIIGVGEGTGAPVMIDIIPQLPPNQMIVTVTKQNYFRYSSTVDVIPPDGPYIVFDSYEINDINGNNNGEVDFGEEILLSMTTRNVGIEEAVDVLVVISLEDSYITLTDNEELFGNILPDEYVTKSDAFGFDVSDSVPDGHKINFEVSSTDANDSTWLSYFSLTALAPALEVGRLDVDDIEGNNNGRIDPGETVDIIIEVENRGHSSALETMGHLSTTSQYLTVNTSTFDLGDLSGDETDYAIFNVTADAGIELGTVVDMIFAVESGYYTAGKTFYSKIGLILEDWETGDFDEFDWEMGGEAPWAITDVNPYEGTYCVKSGDINDQQSSEISLAYDVMADDTISFFYKVSSEASYDYLQFYIDNNMQGQWAGEVGWERVAYPVTAGPHIFTWVYSKDYSVSNGEDCGWIDFISFPPELVTTAYAGLDVSICEDDDCPLTGSATNYVSVEWSTSGTGVFDDNTILTPVYTPGEEDIAAGEVTLTLMAYGPDREDVSDDMTLTITLAPTAYAGDDTSICEGEDFSATTASAENYTELLWATTGDGTFDDATIMMPVYTPGENDILEENVILMLTASSQPCQDAVSEFIIDINPLPTPEISGEEAACQYAEGIPYTTPMAVSSSYYWEITGGEILEGQETNEISVVWNEPGEGLLFLTETNDETLCETTVDYTVTVNEVPVPLITGNDDVCLDETDIMYNTTFVEGHAYEWNITGGVITAGANANEVAVTWEEVGEGEVLVTETISETGCMETTFMTVNVNPLPMIDLNDVSMCHNHVITLDAGNPDAQSWVWSTGETTQTIEVDSSGVGFSGTKDISVIVTSATNCASEKAIVVTIDDCSGIAENLYKLDVNLFPNPNTGTFTIELKAEQNDLLNLKIVDARGAVVFEEKDVHLNGIHTKNLNLSDLHEGIYYLLIDSDKVHVVKKVVIQR